LAELHSILESASEVATMPPLQLVQEPSLSTPTTQILKMTWRRQPGSRWSCFTAL